MTIISEEWRLCSTEQRATTLCWLITLKWVMNSRLSSCPHSALRPSPSHQLAFWSFRAHYQW